MRQETKNRIRNITKYLPMGSYVDHLSGLAKKAEEGEEVHFITPRTALHAIYAVVPFILTTSPIVDTLESHYMSNTKQEERIQQRITEKRDNSLKIKISEEEPREEGE